MKPIINKPQRYVTTDLVEGEVVVVHLLNPKQRFINLRFEIGIKEIPYKPIVTADNALEIEINDKFKDQLGEIEAKIILLENLYTAYNYLFTTKGNELLLLSISLHGIPMNYEIVKKVAKSLHINTPESIWEGHYTSLAISAFVEDIFIQRK